MRGSTHGELATIEGQYIGAVNTAIGTASETDASGNVTVAGTGLTGFGSRLSPLRVRAPGKAFTTADAITETVTLTSGVENYASLQL